MYEDKKGGGLNDPALYEPKEYKVTCPNCKERVVPKDMMCPECHHYLEEKRGTAYQPLSDKTKRTVKIILTVVLLGVFALMVYFGVVTLDGCENTENRLVSLFLADADALTIVNPITARFSIVI